VQSIGEILRRERLRRGLKLDELSAQTKIGCGYLAAIEENRFDRLPGGILTRSFLRQYTRVLGLDEEQAVAYLKEQVGEPSLPLPDPGKSFRTPYLPHLPVLVWLALTMCLGGVVYKFVEKRHPPGSENDAARQDSIGQPDGQRHVAAAPLNEGNALPIREGPGASPTRQVAANPGVMHVVFTATEPVWISVTSDGDHKFSGTIEEQQSREFESSGNMTVLVGNVGGLTILINGQRIGVTGSHGQVRLLELTPDGARVLPRVFPAQSVDESHPGA
jgi:transcriptional regulator with XRE-family HTH domain